MYILLKQKNVRLLAGLLCERIHVAKDQKQACFEVYIVKTLLINTHFNYSERKIRSYDLFIQFLLIYKIYETSE